MVEVADYMDNSYKTDLFCFDDAKLDSLAASLQVGEMHTHTSAL
jgi:hypothetical protein